MNPKHTSAQMLFKHRLCFTCSVFPVETQPVFERVKLLLIPCVCFFTSFENKKVRRKERREGESAAHAHKNPRLHILTAQQLTVSLDAALHLYSMLLMLYFSVVSSMQDIIHQSCSVLGGKKLHLLQYAVYFQTQWKNNLLSNVMLSENKLRTVSQSVIVCLHTDRMP